MTVPYSRALAAVRSVHDGDATRLLDQARRWATTLEAENAVLTARMGTAREYVDALVCLCWGVYKPKLNDRHPPLLRGRCDRCQLLALLAGET